MKTKEEILSFFAPDIDLKLITSAQLNRLKLAMEFYATLKVGEIEQAWEKDRNNLLESIERMSK